MRTFAIRLGIVSALAATTIAIPSVSAGGAEPGGPDAEKLAMLQRIEAAHEEALRAPHAAKELALPSGPQVVEPAWITGIIDESQAPLPAERYVIENQWHDVLGGEHVNVYAGAERADPTHGLVVIDTTALDLTSASTPGGEYRSPTDAGALRIVEAAGTKLILVSSGGARFVFDIASRTFTTA